MPHIKGQRITLEIELEVDGDYEPYVPATRYDPPESGTFAITAARIVHTKKSHHQDAPSGKIITTTTELTEAIELPPLLLEVAEEAAYDAIDSDRAEGPDPDEERERRRDDRGE